MPKDKVPLVIGGIIAAIVGGTVAGVVMTSSEPTMQIIAPRTVINPGNTTGWSARVLDGNQVVNGGVLRWESSDSTVARPVTSRSGLLVGFREGEAEILVTWIKGADSLCAWRPLLVVPKGSPTLAVDTMTVSHDCGQPWFSDSLPDIEPEPIDTSLVPWVGGDSTETRPCAKGWLGELTHVSNDTAFFKGPAVRPETSKHYCIPYNVWIVEDSGMTRDSSGTEGFMTRIVPPSYRADLPGYRGNK